MTPTQTRRLSPLEQMWWYGHLAAENVDAVAERMRLMLEGQFYTFVAANSYDENSDRYSAIDVRTSNQLTQPMRVTKDDGWCGINFVDQSYSWSLHTRAQTEAEARKGRKLDRVHLVFNDSRHRGQSVTIDHYAPAGYRLQWVVVVEHHR